MAKRREGLFVPIGIPIAGAILIGAGLIARPLIQSLATEEQLNQNVLLSAIPFILIFVAIILFYMTLGWFVTSTLNGRIPTKTFKTIENILIAAIILSVIAMFQPWVFAAYRIGFHTLLIATLVFIVWSHIIPKGVQRQETTAEDAAGTSVSDVV